MLLKKKEIFTIQCSIDTSSHETLLVELKAQLDV